MKAVLDTNVFVSGIFWEGSPYNVLSSWKDGKFILVSSLNTVSEIVKVLSDFKIRLPDGAIKEIVDLIVKSSEMVEPQEKIDVIKDDPSDNIFIETAVAGNADYIISQDKHLLKLKEFRKIKILTPEEFNKMSKTTSQYVRNQ